MPARGLPRRQRGRPCARQRAAVPDTRRDYASLRIRAGPCGGLALAAPPAAAQWIPPFAPWPAPYPYLVPVPQPVANPVAVPVNFPWG
jgi:hypothetical protein